MKNFIELNVGNKVQFNMSFKIDKNTKLFELFVFSAFQDANLRHEVRNFSNSDSSNSRAVSVQTFIEKHKTVVPEDELGWRN